MTVYSTLSLRTAIIRVRTPFSTRSFAVRLQTCSGLTTWLLQEFRILWCAKSQSSPYLDCDGKSEWTDKSTLLNVLLEWLPAFRLASYYSDNDLLKSASSDGSSWVEYSPGLDLQKLAISLPAVIVITALLAVQPLGLALLANYASSHYTWTESLDGFALSKLGASIAEDVPVISAMKAGEVKILDKEKGWIGDARGNENIIRQLASGGAEGLKTWYFVSVSV